MSPPLRSWIFRVSRLAGRKPVAEDLLGGVGGGPHTRDRRRVYLAVIFKLVRSLAQGAGHLFGDISVEIRPQARTLFQEIVNFNSGVVDRYEPAATRLSCRRILEFEEMLDDPANLAVQGRFLGGAQIFDLLGEVLPIEFLVRPGTSLGAQRFRLFLRPSEEIFPVE